MSRNEKKDAIYDYLTDYFNDNDIDSVSELSVDDCYEIVSDLYEILGGFYE